MRVPVEFDALGTLPPGWRWQQLQDLAADPRQDIVDGPFGSNLKASEYVDEGVPIARLQNVDRNQFIDKNIRCVTESKAAELARHRFQPGDILLTKLGDPLGKACIVPPAIGGGVIVADLVRIRPDLGRVDRKYLTYALNSSAVIRQLERHTKGTTRPRVNLGVVRELPIPVAPRDEQESVVAELEKQFSRLDEAVANLKRVKANLKHYKTKVLATAAQGDLLGIEHLDSAKLPIRVEAQDLRSAILSWRRDSWEKGLGRRSRYKEPAHPNTDDLPKLPAGWAWMTVEELGPPDRPCAYGVLQPGEETESGVPFVRVGDIADGRIAQANLKRISPQIAAAYPRTQLEGGELLITLVGTIGRAAIAPSELSGANVARAVAVVPLCPQVNSRWIELWFRSPQQVQLLNLQAHEVARKTLNLEDVRKAPVALPPLAVQNSIVREADALLSRAEATERDVAIAETRVETLRHAVLADAFSARQRQAQS